MRHKKLVVAFSAALFATIIFLSACLIFTVRNVTVDYTCTTKKTEEEIVQAKQRLEGFLGKNVFSVNEDEVVATLSDNPYVKVISVSVNLPARLSVKVEERAEFYCVRNGDKYYNLTKENYVLCEIGSNQARLDGEPLALIDGDTVPMSVNGEFKTEDVLMNTAISLINAFDDVRNEIISVTVDRYNEDSASSHNEWNRITVQTREGAIFTITEANVFSDRKVALVASVYSMLEFEERTNGSVLIFTGENDTVGYEISVG